MADLMQFDLVSPERRLASFKVSSVRIPGVDGDLTAMPDHAPLITTLRPGVLRVNGPEGTKAYFVTGGFADVAGPSATILAERAIPVDEVTPEIMDELIKDAETKRSGAVDNVADALSKFLSDLIAARDEIKIGTTSPPP